jgi:hypothetical protein
MDGRTPPEPRIVDSLGINPDMFLTFASQKAAISRFSGAGAMDQELETFVGLLNKNRAVRPVSDELAHLPNWAQQALSRLPETAAPRRALPLNGHAPEPKLKPDLAIAPPAPVVQAPVVQAPVAPAAPAYDPLAAIIRELEAPIEPPVARARRVSSPEPIPVAAIPVDRALVVAPKRERKPAAPGPEKLARALTAKKIIATAAVVASPASAGEILRVSVAAPGEPPASAAVLPVVDETERRSTTSLESKAKPGTTPSRSGPLVAVAAGTAVIATVALLAGGYWYANQRNLSLGRDGMSLASNGLALARNMMTLLPPMPSARKMIAQLGLPISDGKSPAENASAANHAASAPVAPATAKSTAPASSDAAEVAAAAPGTKPSPDQTVADATAPAIKSPETPLPIAKAKLPARDASFEQVAMLTGPIPAAAPPIPKRVQESGGEPTWRRNAVAAPPYNGEPQIAIVIDDLGIDSNRTQRAIALDGAVTLSFLAYASNLPEQTEAARKAGHELIVHVPMEPIIRPKFISAGSGGTGVAHEELLRRLRWDLSRFTGYVGVNNHMGNQLASDPESTQTVVAELKARGLLFLDSRGSKGGAVAIAERLGVPTVSRDVFLDDDVGASSIDERLAALEKVARAQGTAIAIGHPHDRTLEALHVWLASLASKGLQLVPLTAIVKDREQHVAGAS